MIALKYRTTKEKRLLSIGKKKKKKELRKSAIISVNKNNTMAW